MHRRPDSVLIISILCTIFGALSVFGMLLILGSGTDTLPAWMGSAQRDKLNVLMVVGSFDALATFFCGIFMFQGANWARWVFAVEAAMSTAVFACFFMDNLPALGTTFGFRVICIVFLFLPDANKFFVSRSRRRW